MAPKIVSLSYLLGAAVASRNVQVIPVDGQSIQLQGWAEGDAEPARRTGAASRGHQHAETAEHRERAREIARLQEELQAMRRHAAPPSPEPVPFQYTPTHEAKNELFETCSVRAPPTRRDTELSNTTGGDAHRYHSGCAADFLALTKFTVAAAESTCCPSGDERCSGCVSWLPSGDASGSCAACQGGFVKRSGKCISCVDTAGWTNAEGKTCSQLSRLGTAACTDLRVMGLSSNQVCCFCGGGNLLGTTFKYPEAMQEVGGSISVKPEPRTASLYSLNEGCELAKYGLSMDGATGVVSGTPTTTEPFEVECEVTAHQGGGASATATVAVKSGQLIYESSVLVFKGAATYTPRVASSLALENYKVKCVPEIPWMTVDAVSGELRREASLASASGMLTEVGDFASGQPGGVCHITATSGATSYSTSVLAVAPRPWGTFQYGTGTASSVIGDIFPVMSPQEPTNVVENALKPDYFTAACETTYPPSAAFEFWFDTQLSMGMLEGHKLFELREDGSLSFAPSSTLSTLFDGADMSVDFHTVQKAIQLQCRVYGHFAEPLLEPLSTQVNLEIRDSICFILEEFNGTQVSVPNATLTSCRMACRGNSSCSHFHFKDGGCYQYTRDSSAAVAATTGTTYQALAKVTDCNANNICLEVDLDHHAAYLTGTYCPQGYDVSRGVVYQKTGSTAQENLWLARLTSHDPTPTGITCNYLDGYVVRQVDSEVDLINKEAGSFELRGTPRACLRKELVSSAFGNVEAAIPTRYSQPAHDSGVAGLLQQIPPTPAVYVTRAEGTAGCLPGQEVLTKALCVVAAGELGFSQGISEGSDAGAPAGCSTSREGTRLYFNTHAAGAGAVGRVPICFADVATLNAPTCRLPDALADQIGEPGVSPMMIDLPSTIEEQDYWTHPCDCAPPHWGAHAPVDISLHAHIPPGSNNIFIPPPFDIVEGQYACDIKYILSVHPESTEGVAMDQGACQSLCSDNPLCGFYWSGTQRGLTSCRLYTACDNLVREFDSVGTLVAVPRKEMCQISDPDACWKTTLRREFLTHIKTTTCASHTCSAGSSPRPDAENTVCGHLHQADSPNCTDERCCIEDHFRVQTSGCSRSECTSGACVAVAESIGLTKDVTCCSDVPRRNWVNVRHKHFFWEEEGMCGNVWANSPHCGTKMSFFEAQTYCHALGARLCSYNEVKANCTQGSGCDGSIVWTSESCASTAVGGKCPALYPVCQADGDCAVAGCRSGDCVWRHAPHTSSHPTKGLFMDSSSQKPYVYERATAYTYLDGYDAAGSLCSRDYDASTLFDMFVFQDHGRLDNAVEKIGPEGSFSTCVQCATACLFQADCMAFSSYVDTCSADSTQTGNCFLYVGRPHYWIPDTYWSWRAPDPSSVTTGKLYVMKGRGTMEGDIGTEVPHICTANNIVDSPKSCSDYRGLTFKHQRRMSRGSALSLASLDQMPVDMPSSADSREGIFCPPGKFALFKPDWSFECCDAQPPPGSTTCATLEPTPSPTFSCSCPNGDPPPPGDARCKGGHYCASCNAGFELSSADNLCSVRQCTCDNGRAASGIFCPTHGASLCLSCTLGYTLEGQACTKDAVYGGYPEYVAPAFHYLNLHRQCDQELLLGGSGVEHCSRPTYADPNSHAWKHKRLPPTVFKHGEVLNVSCWPERYSGVAAGRAAVNGSARSYAEIQCVHGDWFDRATGASGLDNFQCASCVQVAEPGYALYHAQRKQEVMWTNRLVNRLYSDGAVRECIHGSGVGSATKFGPTVTCDRFLFRSTKYSADMSKLLQFAGGTGLCLSGSPSGFTKETCDQTSSEQLTKTSDVDRILWHMHGKVSNVAVVTKAGTGHDIRSLEGEGTCMPQGAFGSLNLGVENSTCHFAPVLQHSAWTLAPYGNVTEMLTCHGCKGYPIWYLEQLAATDDAARENLREHVANMSVAWRHQLAGAEVKCSEGQALVAVRFRHDGLHFKCAYLSGLGECMPSFTEQYDVEPKGIDILAEMTIQCPGHDVIGSFHFEQSDMGKWARWRYTCCKAGGVPTVMEPVRLDKTLSMEAEGLYCPVKLDESGRLTYQSRGLVGKTIPHKTMAYDNMNGQWCLEGDCVDSMSVEPIGVESPGNWEAVDVDDFDMAASSPGDKQDQAQLDAVQRYLRKTPRSPTVPKLLAVDFTKKEWQPEYSSECKFDQFDDLTPFVWDKVSDKHGDETLQYFDTYNGSVPDGHPCKVAQLSKKRGMLKDMDTLEKYGGYQPDVPEWAGHRSWKDLLQGDWKYHQRHTYDSIFNCGYRRIFREWIERAHREHYNEVNGAIDLANDASTLLCGLIPDMVLAPFGVGTKIQWSDMCGMAKGIGIATAQKISWHQEINAIRERQHGGETTAADCDPLQEGLARLFCDTHCVRDAVVRGEKNLRRVLSKATEITNANLRAFANWNVESLNTQALHVGQKINWLQDYLGLRLDSGNLQLDKVSASLTGMVSEMQGLASKSRLEAHTRASTFGALKAFLGSAEVASAEPGAENYTQYVQVLEQVASLHATLKAGSQRSTASSASMLLSEGVRMQLGNVRTMMSTLGHIRKHGEMSKSAVREWSTTRAAGSMLLVQMDKVWWRTRQLLDEFLEQSEEYLHAFRDAFEALANYRECSSGFSQLLGVYNRAMAVRARTHKKLRETWRKSSNSLGEIASIVVDGDIFANFMAQEGCNSELAVRTQQQVASAARAILFLLVNYREAGLEPPSLQGCMDALQRVHTSFSQARASCLADS